MRGVGNVGGNFSRAQIEKWEATKGVFTVTGINAYASHYDAVAAQVERCKQNLGGTVRLPRIGGAGYEFHTPILIDFDYCTIEYDDKVRITRTTALSGDPAVIANRADLIAKSASVFIFSGDLWSPTKTYLKGCALIAKRPGLRVDGNARNIVGYDYVLGKTGPHNAVTFLGCENPYLSKVWAYNGLVGGITLSYCPGASSDDCCASDSLYDNGFYQFNNKEHIAAFNDDDKNTWANSNHRNVRAWNCDNHGAGVWGAVGVTFVSPKIWNCGNNNVVNRVSGPFGGLGVEYDPSAPERDLRFVATDVDVTGSYGFGVRTNAAGTRIQGRVRNLKYPTNYGAMPQAALSSACFIQTGARDCEIDIEIEDSEGYGIVIQGGDTAWFSGYIVGNLLTVTAVTSGTITKGLDLGGANVPAGVLYIKAQASGTVGGVGTYTLNRAVPAIGSVGAPVAILAGAYPTARIKAKVKGAKSLAMYGYGFGKVEIDPASLFTANGDPTDTTNGGIFTFSNALVNTGGGELTIHGRFDDNNKMIAQITTVKTVTLTEIYGRDNGRALAAAYHSIYLSGTIGTLMAATIVLDDGISRNARFIKSDAAITKAIISKRTILGPITNTNKSQVDLVGATTYIGDAPLSTIFPNYTASYTPNSADGNFSMSALTGNLTVNADAPPHLAPTGSQLTMKFAQDATGGRTITWNAAWKGATLTGSGTASQKALVTFQHTGTEWVQVASTGWYS